MASCVKINTANKRRNLIAMLSGDVEKVESLLKQNNGKPLPVFDVSWGSDYYYFDSYLTFLMLLPVKEYYILWTNTSQMRQGLKEKS